MISFERAFGIIFLASVICLCLTVCTFPPAIAKASAGHCHEEKNDAGSEDSKSCCSGKAILTTGYEPSCAPSHSECVPYKAIFFSEDPAFVYTVYMERMREPSGSPPITVLRI